MQSLIFNWGQIRLMNNFGPMYFEYIGPKLHMSVYLTDFAFMKIAHFLINYLLKWQCSKRKSFPQLFKSCMMVSTYKASHWKHWTWNTIIRVPSYIKMSFLNEKNQIKRSMTASFFEFLKIFLEFLRNPQDPLNFLSLLAFSYSIL